MLNNDVRLIGRALADFQIFDKMATFKIEMTKQKKGETYELEVKAYTNSKTIKLDEKIKGRLVAVQGFIDDKYQIIASNVMPLTVAASSPKTVADVEVVTAKDLEKQENIEITDDDLPF